MNSDRINWWLTVGANVGVLIGLIFVGLEVRNSGKAVTAQTVDSIADGFNTMNLAAIEDPFLAEALYNGLLNPESLDDLSTYRFSLLVRSFFNQYHRVYRLYQLGLLPDADWVNYATEIKGFMELPGVKVYLDGNPVPQDFVSDVLKTADDTRELDYTLGRGSLEFENVNDPSGQGH